MATDRNSVTFHRRPAIEGWRHLRQADVRGIWPLPRRQDVRDDLQVAALHQAYRRRSGRSPRTSRRPHPIPAGSMPAGRCRSARRKRHARQARADHEHAAASFQAEGASQAEVRLSSRTRGVAPAYRSWLSLLPRRLKAKSVGRLLRSDYYCTQVRTPARLRRRASRSPHPTRCNASPAPPLECAIARTERHRSPCRRSDPESRRPVSNRLPSRSSVPVFFEPERWAGSRYNPTGQDRWTTAAFIGALPEHALSRPLEPEAKRP